MTPRYPALIANRLRPFSWILIENVRIELSDGTTLLIPKGYIFDGSSVPRVFWSLLPPHGTDIYSALVHDYLFTIRQLGYMGYSLSFVDREYLRFCLDDNYRTGVLRPYILFLGVKLFSWMFWRTKMV